MRQPGRLRTRSRPVICQPFDPVGYSRRTKLPQELQRARGAKRLHRGVIGPVVHAHRSLVPAVLAAGDEQPTDAAPTHAAGRHRADWWVTLGHVQVKNRQRTKSSRRDRFPERNLCSSVGFLIPRCVAGRALARGCKGDLRAWPLGAGCTMASGGSVCRSGAGLGAVGPKRLQKRVRQKARGERSQYSAWSRGSQPLLPDDLHGKVAQAYRIALARLGERDDMFGND